MAHARGARAVRDTVAQYTGADGMLSQPDVCAAMVAVQLGLIDEAEKLYAGCGRYELLNALPLPLAQRLPQPQPQPVPVPQPLPLPLPFTRYDLLNELYQCSGQWDKAVQVAEEKDRIHLKATHDL